MTASPKPSPLGRALLLGALCAFAYFSVSNFKSILSVYSPALIGEGVFSEGQIGALSSLGFFSYALGQLGSGFFGDRCKGAGMMGIGLAGAGLCALPMPFLFSSFPALCLLFLLNGLFLSMIFAPMTRLVAENAPASYVTRCTLGYTLASFLGSPCAGALSSFLPFRPGFLLSGGLLLGAGALCALLPRPREGEKALSPGRALPSPAEKAPASLRGRRLPAFFLLAMLTGVVRTALVFYLPGYLQTRLALSPEAGALCFSLVTLGSALSSFLAIFLYERLGRRLSPSLFFFLLGTALCFFLAALLSNPLGNLLSMAGAILFANCASNLLWTVYCPSLRDTGRVSTVTGALDFSGYMAAAAVSALFPLLLSLLGWRNLLLALALLHLPGALCALPARFFRLSPPFPSFLSSLSSHFSFFEKIRKKF